MTVNKSSIVSQFKNLVPGRAESSNNASAGGTSAPQDPMLRSRAQRNLGGPDHGEDHANGRAAPTRAARVATVLALNQRVHGGTALVHHETDFSPQARPPGRGMNFKEIRTAQAYVRAHAEQANGGLAALDRIAQDAGLPRASRYVHGHGISTRQGKQIKRKEKLEKAKEIAAFSASFVAAIPTGGVSLFAAHAVVERAQRRRQDPARKNVLDAAIRLAQEQQADLPLHYDIATLPTYQEAVEHGNATETNTGVAGAGLRQETASTSATVEMNPPRVVDVPRQFQSTNFADGLLTETIAAIDAMNRREAPGGV
jgi:hypothetical protein